MNDHAVTAARIKALVAGRGKSGNPAAQLLYGILAIEVERERYTLNHAAEVLAECGGDLGASGELASVKLDRNDDAVVWTLGDGGARKGLAVPLGALIYLAESDNPDELIRRLFDSCDAQVPLARSP